MSPQAMLIVQTLLGVAVGVALTVFLRSRSTPTTVGLLAALALAAIPVTTWDPPASNGRRLRVVSVLDGATTQALAAAFTRETGIVCDVDPFAGGTQTTVELIQQGRVQPDVLLGGTVEIHERLARDDKLARYDLPPDPARVADYDDPDQRWTPLYLGYIALVYRPLPSFQSHPPEWLTLIQPQWNGRVTIPSPTASGGGLVFLATQILRQPDPERAWRYMELLVDSGARFEDRSDIPISRVAAGTMDLGVAWAHDILRRREVERLPVELRIPDQTGYEVGGVSILQWARDRDAAAAFVRFLTGPVAGEIQVREGRRVPLRTDVDPPEYIEAGRLDSSATAFYDRVAVLANRETWGARWQDLLTPVP
ncbi:MAG: extracellular solute-binding protein [Gemmatimonadetes bacterium]|nr:extracellular solute-binding protein [Gemmatimonadota bacterium]